MSHFRFSTRVGAIIIIVVIIITTHATNIHCINTMMIDQNGFTYQHSFGHPPPIQHPPPMQHPPPIQHPPRSGNANRGPNDGQLGYVDGA